jgi:hypothetical protein
VIRGLDKGFYGFFGERAIHRVFHGGDRVRGARRYGTVGRELGKPVKGEGRGTTQVPLREREVKDVCNSNGNVKGNDNDNSRFPSGMTKK